MGQKLKSWNVKKCTDFASMFEYAYKFNKGLDDWNPFSATYMNYMFAGAVNFDKCLSTWDYMTPSVANITDMLVPTACYDMYPKKGVSPWCQKASNKCKAYEPRGSCENSPYFNTGSKKKPKDCVKTFQNFEGTDKLKTECDKEKSTLLFPFKVTGNDLCPASCNVTSCCQNDETTVFTTSRGTFTGCAAFF